MSAAIQPRTVSLEDARAIMDACKRGRGLNVLITPWGRVVELGDGQWLYLYKEDAPIQVDETSLRSHDAA